MIAQTLAVLATALVIGLLYALAIAALRSMVD